MHLTVAHCRRWHRPVMHGKRRHGRHVPLDRLWNADESGLCGGLVRRLQVDEHHGQCWKCLPRRHGRCCVHIVSCRCGGVRRDAACELPRHDFRHQIQQFPRLLALAAHRAYGLRRRAVHHSRRQHVCGERTPWRAYRRGFHGRHRHSARHQIYHTGIGDERRRVHGRWNGCPDGCRAAGSCPGHDGRHRRKRAGWTFSRRPRAARRA